MSAITTERALLAPLFLQSASVEPALAASLSILAGYNLSADVQLDPVVAASADGAALATLADLLRAAGLRIRCWTVPADTLGLLATRGPLVAMAQPSDAPDSLLVVWRRVGPLAHVLDTRSGRRWLSVRRLGEAAEERVVRLSGEEWRLQSEASAWLLRVRLAQLTRDDAAGEPLVQRALDEPGWRPLAALDAAIRLADRLVEAGAVERGDEARDLIGRLVAETLALPAGAPGPIPAACWAVSAEGDQPEGALLCRGVSVVLSDSPSEEGAPARRVRPRRRYIGRLAGYCCDQPGMLGLIGVGLGVAAAGVVAQALILRGLLVLGQFLPTVGERTAALGLLLGLVLALLLIEGSLATLLGRLGRRLDARLRMAFMILLPRLGSQSFQRLSTADLMERIHTVRDLHNLPDLSGQLARTFFQLLFTLLGLALISPLCAAIGLTNVGLVVGLVLVGAEVAGAQNRELRMALAELSRLVLDGMLGSVSIHAHLAGPALRSEHERRLARWARPALALAKTELWISALGAIISALLVALSVVIYSLDGMAAHLPLLLFWSLQLGALSEQLARLGFSFVGELSKAERYLELTGLPIDEAPAEHAAAAPPTPPNPGAALALDGVHVEHDGQTILNAIRLSIAPGSHVAIVGHSGAGKSTLVGLLLGRAQPTRGTLLVDGVPLSGQALGALRAQTAWVDPGVQIWNRSFLDNITYGSEALTPHAAVDQIAGALVEQLPNGMQSTLGERGRLVSGGQGQRVRYGRAIQRQAARLVILDEPFRGLDREQRWALLAHARACWPGATLLCVTHDIAHTTSFERVLVLADGHLVEDGCPAELLAQEGSRYATLLADDQAVDAQIWAGREVPWRRVTLSEGRLEAPAASVPPPSSPSAERLSEPDPCPPPANGLTWGGPRLPELLVCLARQTRAGHGLPNLPDLPREASSIPPDQQIASLAGQLGMEADPFNVSGRAIGALLSRSGPALLRLADGRWIGLLSGGRWWVRVIRADGVGRSIPVARLRSALRQAHERPAQDAVERLLAPLALEERQRELAAPALLRDEIAAAQVAEGWSLRLEPETPLWPQLRQAGVPQTLLLAAICEAALSLLFVLSMVGAGLLAAQGRIIWPWIFALALCLLSYVPVDLFKRHCNLTVSLRLRTLLKRRLHADVIRLLPGDIQQYGIGQFLSWLMEAERLESIVSAGPLLITSLVALLICAALLAGGAGGGLLAPLLLGWLGATALLSWRAYRAYLAQRSCHIETSRDTLERLDGHLTRLAQESQAHWHSDEDAALERYLALSKRDDHYRGALATLVPYGWLLLALASLAPTLLAWPGDVLRLGLSLLGISWGFQLLRTLAPTILDLSRALGAWQLLAPVERSARRPIEAAPMGDICPPQTGERPILEARNLSFGYLGQRQPLISHGDLTVYSGERLLLTGPSGGGKSTLATLLARLRPAQSGLLLLHGLDQHTLSAASWRRRVVMVAQFHENHLFSASLAFNLLMGRRWPPSEADLREAEQICRELGLADLLRRIPAGLGQPVGEGGWQLSHGERSRVFVARALLQQAHILILDESLAAIDAANLRATMSCVLARAPTLILIAHP